MTRLAVILSHPIQYFSPWFRQLATEEGLELRVFYLWDFGVTRQKDRDFGTEVQWDIPLLDGYESEFVPNRSGEPGTHHFRGLQNPELVGRLGIFKPDAILMFGYNYQSHLRVLLSRRLRGVPIFFRGDSHGLGRSNSFGELFKLNARRLVFRRFAAFLAVGRANADWIAQHGISPQRIFFAPHCVDNERFASDPEGTRAEALAWRRELGIRDEQTVVLFAGKLEGKKQPLLLLRAFAEILHDLPATADSVLLFVGHGPLEEELKQRAGELSSRVVFAPFQNQTRMPRTYAAADLFVLPSAGSSETWGLGVNEAMNLERPIVVSSHVGCAEDLVKQGRNGWVFEAGKQEDLEEVLRDALSDKKRLKKFGLESKQIVQDYSYGAATRGLQQALDYVFARPS